MARGATRASMSPVVGAQPCGSGKVSSSRTQEIRAEGSVVPAVGQLHANQARAGPGWAVRDILTNDSFLPEVPLRPCSV